MLQYLMLLLAIPPLAETPPLRVDHQFFLTEAGCEQAALRAGLPPGYRIVCLPVTVSAANDPETLIAHY